MSRSLCFNTNTDQICLQITPLAQVNGDVLQSQGILSSIRSALGGGGTQMVAAPIQPSNPIATLGAQVQSRLQALATRCSAQPSIIQQANSRVAEIAQQHATNPTADISFARMAAINVIEGLERQC